MDLDLDAYIYYRYEAQICVEVSWCQGTPKGWTKSGEEGPTVEGGAKTTKCCINIFKSPESNVDKRSKLKINLLFP